MRKIMSVMVFCTVLLMVGCTSNKPVQPNPSPPPIGDKSDEQKGSGQVIEQGDKNKDNNVQKTTVTVKVFLIALDDNGKGGKKIDSGDSIIPVERTISTPNTPLAGALSELLAIKERNYGQSGLYNALYQSNLKIDKVNLVEGIATINLSGKLMLGGVMDIPRVKAQLAETAFQFNTVKEVKIYINGKTLDEALSLK